MSFHRNLRGKDLHSPSTELVENNSGSDIAVLTCVTFTSMGASFPSIRPAEGGVDVVRGIAQSLISNGGTGYITSLGFLNGVDTQNWNPGTRLYCTSSGTLTSAMNGLPVGVVLKKHATDGVIYVDNTGVTAADIANTNFPPEAELEIDFFVQYPRPYKKYTYNPTGDIVDLDIYADETQTIHVYNKHFSYDTDGNLISVVSTNLISGLSKSRIISYDAQGQMISIDET